MRVEHFYLLRKILRSCRRRWLPVIVIHLRRLQFYLALQIMIFIAILILSFLGRLLRSPRTDTLHVLARAPVILFRPPMMLIGRFQMLSLCFGEGATCASNRVPRVIWQVLLGD